MNAEDLVTLLIPVTYFILLGLEHFAPGREWPQVRFWRTRGVAFFVLLMAINAILPSLLPEDLTRHHLLDAGRLPLPLQVVAGYLAVSLANALVHRASHRFDFMWRWIHQLHHSPQRLDMSGSVYFTPYDMALNTVTFLAVVVFVLGLDPLAAAITGYIAAFYGMFQHLNVRTPRWLGILIQRPESHSVHHRRGFHAYNYSDLPLWDMAMGTFRNPREFHGDVGFEGDAPERMGAMLIGRDANAGLYGAGSRGSREPATNPA